MVPTTTSAPTAPTVPSCSGTFCFPIEPAANEADSSWYLFLIIALLLALILGCCLYRCCCFGLPTKIEIVEKDEKDEQVEEFQNRENVNAIAVVKPGSFGNESEQSDLATDDGSQDFSQKGPHMAHLLDSPIAEGKGVSALVETDAAADLSSLPSTDPEEDDFIESEWQKSGEIGSTNHTSARLDEETAPSLNTTNRESQLPAKVGFMFFSSPSVYHV